MLSTLSKKRNNAKRAFPVHVRALKSLEPIEFFMLLLYYPSMCFFLRFLLDFLCWSFRRKEIKANDNNNTCTVSSCNRINTWTVSFLWNFLRFNRTFSTLRSMEIPFALFLFLLECMQSPIFLSQASQFTEFPIFHDDVNYGEKFEGEKMINCLEKC